MKRSTTKVPKTTNPQNNWTVKSGAQLPEANITQQKYAIVWWMRNNGLHEFSEVMETKKEAKAFARELRDSGYVSEEEIQIRKA